MAADVSSQKWLPAEQGWNVECPCILKPNGRQARLFRLLLLLLFMLLLVAVVVLIVDVTNAVVVVAVVAVCCCCCCCSLHFFHEQGDMFHPSQANSRSSPHSPYPGAARDRHLRLRAPDAPGAAWERLGEGQLLGGGTAARRRAGCLLYTSPSPRDGLLSRMPSSA